MKKFKQVLLTFQALSLRERVLAVAAAVVVLYFLFDFALIAPQRNKNKVLQQQIEQQKVERGALAQVLAAGVANNKPADGLAKERDDLRARVAEAETFIAHAANGGHIDEVIRAMIAATPGLTLVSFRTLPAEVFYKPGGAFGANPNEAAPKLLLYKHGVEVAIKGKYLALVPYLQKLERSPNRIFWANVKLDVGTYPEAMLRMTIYILSEQAESPLG